MTSDLTFTEKEHALSWEVGSALSPFVTLRITFYGGHVKAKIAASPAEVIVFNRSDTYRGGVAHWIPELYAEDFIGWCDAQLAAVRAKTQPWRLVLAESEDSAHLVSCAEPLKYFSTQMAALSRARGEVETAHH